MLIVVPYAFYSHNPISSRIGYANFMSITPALVTLAAVKLVRTRYAVAAIYALLFIALQLIWYLLHG